MVGLSVPIFSWLAALVGALIVIIVHARMRRQRPNWLTIVGSVGCTLVPAGLASQDWLTWWMVIIATAGIMFAGERWPTGTSTARATRR
jgi:hypothetical protein